MNNNQNLREHVRQEKIAKMVSYGVPATIAEELATVRVSCKTTKDVIAMCGQPDTSHRLLELAKAKGLDVGAPANQYRSFTFSKPEWDPWVLVVDEHAEGEMAFRVWEANRGEFDRND
jgi:hypothetical protein